MNQTIKRFCSQPMFFFEAKDYGTFINVLLAIAYLIGLIYFFLGMSVACDRFMEAIEVIISKERVIFIPNNNPKLPPSEIKVRIWNETIANLTLLALGSSTPEILLSFIESMGRKFESGELGPGTIIGSAAYNLFIIVGICILAIPNGESRYLKSTNVFICTSLWSLFAYLWTYLVLVVISRDVIEIWEATLTLAFFAITIISSYMVDKNCFYTRKSTVRIPYHSIHGRHSINLATDKRFSVSRKISQASIVAENGQIRPSVIVIQKLRGIPTFYHSWSRSGSKISPETIDDFAKDGQNQHVLFKNALITVSVKDRFALVEIIRAGGDLKMGLMVNYVCIRGDALHYIESPKTIEFMPEQTSVKIRLPVNSKIFSGEEKYFFVELENPRYIVNNNNTVTDDQMTVDSALPTVFLSAPAKCVVLLKMFYSSGVFTFASPVVLVSETTSTAFVKIKRLLYCDTDVVLPYTISDEKAYCGFDYVDCKPHEVLFKNGQKEEQIKIKIINNNEKAFIEKNFKITLNVPVTSNENPDVAAEIFEMSESSDPSMKLHGSTASSGKLIPIKDRNITKESMLNDTGIFLSTNVIIRAGENQKNDVYKNESDESDERDATCCELYWDQIVDSFSIHEEESNCCMQYLMNFIRFISVPWRFICATIPPSEICGGYLAFFVAIVYIAVLTAIVGDMANNLGCYMFMSNSLTALTFVAIGTSMPDTFASLISAVNDQSADAAVGNVTGSNAVNVFLGLGLAWTVCSIYHGATGSIFRVSSQNISFMVNTYLIMASILLIFLFTRRIRFFGGELGGNVIPKYVSGFIFIFSWFFFILLMALRLYNLL